MRANRNVLILYLTCLLVIAFVIVPNSSKGACTDKDSSLIGTVWRWQCSLYNNNTESVPPDPDRYTLMLQPDGQINIRADCNMGGGTYTLDGKKISITITHTTRAACPPESLEQPYISDLNGVAGWFFKERDLYLDIKYDTGTMKFSK